MTERAIDGGLKTSLLNNDSFIYYNLIKFERPQLSSIAGDVSQAATDFAYLTDAPFSVSYDDGEGQGEQVYVPNKILNVGTISETIQAKATTMSLKLSTSALGSYVSSASIDFFEDTNNAYFDVDFDMGLEGFREGDKIIFSGGNNNGKYIRIDRFNINPAHGIRNSRIHYTSIDTITTGSDTCTISIGSEEIRNLTSLKQGGVTTYSSYLNREVRIYRVHADPETGSIKGAPFLLFRGIIASASIDEKPESTSFITWGLTSHWGDFVRTNGRLTSDSAHRAVGETGRADISSVVRPEYAVDYGFQHAERAVNVIAEFTYKELRYNYKDASTINKVSFGLFGSGPKIQEEWIDVERDVDLRFNLNARYLPVVYGVQKIENNPIFVDVNKDAPEEVYIAYALCEGEIGGIYDIYIDDQPSVCLDQADFESRQSGLLSDPDNNINVVCYGRADRGDVLSGSSYLSATPEDIEWQNIEDDLWVNPSYLRGGWYGNPINERNFGSIYNNDDGSPLGLRHEDAYTFEVPIDATFVVHTGKPDQEANDELVSLASKRQFKIQNSYFKGDPGQYWSTSHRLLDTAYVVCKFTLSEGEESFPEYKFVIKGKYIDCHNYDSSFKVVSGDTSHYEVGDIVTVDTGLTTVYTDVQIVDKWTIYDKDGNEDVRFRWRTNYPNDGDTIVEFDSQQEITMTGTTDQDTITMRAAGYMSSTANNISSYPIGHLSTGTITYTKNGDIAENLYATFTGGPFITMATWGGADNVYISPVSNPNVAFRVTGISGSNLYFAPFSGAYDSLLKFDDQDFIISNGIVATNTADDENLIKVYKTISSITESRTKEILKADTTNGYIFTTVPFTADFFPENGDTFDVIWQHKDLRVSLNPVMQTLDYVTSKRYGQGLDIDKDINLDTWLESARLCDDQSKVTIVTDDETPPTPGTICTLTINDGTRDKLLFQGTVSNVEEDRITGFHEVEFDYVLGKLGYKHSYWREFNIGDYVWWNGRVQQVTSIPDEGAGVDSLGRIQIPALFFPEAAENVTISLAKEPSGSVNVYTGDLGGLKGSNPIIRSWSDQDLAFSAPGYSLYDSDEVVYWKYLGWEAPEQRFVTRHQMNQIVNTTTPIFDNINSMLEQFNGILRYVNGKYELDIRTAAPPVSSLVQGIHKLSEDDIIGGIKLDDKGQKKSYNSISASIFDPQNKFATRAVTFFDSNYLKEDRGISKQGKLGLSGITNYFNARNNVVQFLKESRYGLTINFTMDQKGYLLLPGEIIALNYSRFEWVDKLFRISDIDIKVDGLVTITAKEHNDDAYLLDYTDRDFSYIKGTIKGVNYIRPPSGLEASQGLDGAIQLTWTNTNQYNPVLYDIEVWAAEAAKDTNGDYILNTAGIPDPIYNTFTRATLLDKADGDFYLHMLPQDSPDNYIQHVWYYWIRYVKPPVAFREKAKYSAYEPTQTADDGIVGKAYDVMADNNRNVFLTATSLIAIYDEQGALESPTTADITFTATPFGTIGTEYYDFTVLDINGGVVSTSQVDSNTDGTGTFVYSPPLTIQSDSTDSRWMPESIMVELREDSASAPVEAMDIQMVQGLSEASSAIRIELQNPNQYVPISAEGVIDLSGSGTTIKVWEGDAPLTAVLSPDPDGSYPDWTPEVASLAAGQFTVVIEDIYPTDSMTTSYVTGGAGPWTAADNTITVLDHTTMDVERTRITYRIVVKRFNGLEVNFYENQSFLRVGISGARSCQVLPADTSILYNANGSDPLFTEDTDGHLAIGASSEGYENPYYRLKINGEIHYDTHLTQDGGGFAQAETDGTLEFHYAVPDTIADQVNNKFELETKEGPGGSVSSQDIQNVVFIMGGKDGFAAWLSNSSHPLTADANGENYDLSNAGGLFEVWIGGVDVRDEVTFRVNSQNPDTNGISEDTQNGLTFTIESGTTNPGIYYLSSTTNGWTELAETFIVTATHDPTGAVFERKYTIVKSIAGQNVRFAELDADAVGVHYNVGGEFSPATINLTATALNYNDPEYGFWTELDSITGLDPVLSGCAIWDGHAGTDSWSSDPDAIFTPPPNFTDWNGLCQVKVYIKESTDTTEFNTVSQGYLSIVPTSSAQSAINPEVSNQFHQLIETPGGLNYDGSGTYITVYEGISILEFQPDGELSKSIGTTLKWRIIDRTYGGALSDTGMVGNEPNMSVTSGGSAYIAELDSEFVSPSQVPWDLDELVGWCDYTLEIRREEEKEGSVIRVVRQTFNRAVEGADGVSPYLVEFSNRVHVIPCESAALGYANANWINSGTAIVVWHENQKLPYDQGLNGTTFPCWHVVSRTIPEEYNNTANTGIYNVGSGGPLTDGVTYAAGPINWGDQSTAWEFPYGEVVYQIQVAGTNSSDIVFDELYTQQFTRVPGNATPGRDALTFVLDNETHSVPANADGSNHNGSGSSVTIYGYYGDDKLIYNPEAGTGSPGWKVLTLYSSPGIIVGSTSYGTEDNYLSYADHTFTDAFTQGLLQFYIVGWHDDGTRFPTDGYIVKRQTLSTNYNGISVKINPSSLVVPYNEVGALTSSNLTFNTTVYGLTEPEYRWTSEAEGVTTGWGIYGGANFPTRTWLASNMPNTYDAFLSPTTGYGGSKVEIKVEVRENNTTNAIAEDTITVVAVKENLDGFSDDVIGDILLVPSDFNGSNYPYGGTTEYLLSPEGGGHVGRFSIWDGNTDITNDCGLDWDVGSFHIPYWRRIDSGDGLRALLCTSDNYGYGFKAGHFYYIHSITGSPWTGESVSFTVKGTVPAPYNHEFKRFVSVHKNKRGSDGGGAIGTDPTYEPGTGDSPIISASLKGTSISGLTTNNATATAGFTLDNNGYLYKFSTNLIVTSFHKWLEAGVASDFEVSFTWTGNNPKESYTPGAWYSCTTDRTVSLEATSTHKFSTVTIKLRNAITTNALAVAEISLHVRSSTAGFNPP